MWQQLSLKLPRILNAQQSQYHHRHSLNKEHLEQQFDYLESELLSLNGLFHYKCRH